MFDPIYTRRSRADLVTIGEVDFEWYTRIWQGWFRGNSGQRWGQYLFNSLDLKEEQAPGLFYAETVKEANAIFNRHFKLVA